MFRQDKVLPKGYCGAISKARAVADHIQTQPIFDVPKFAKWIEFLRGPRHG